MKELDQQLQQRVWQRVNQREEPTEDRRGNLRALILEEWTSAGVYGELYKLLPEKESIRRLFRQEHSHGACLRGIYWLLTGERPVIPGIKPAGESLEVMLRQCYGRQMRMLAEYEKRSQDPEFGPAFARMAQQEREHCHAVLELMGKFEK